MAQFIINTGGSFSIIDTLGQSQPISAAQNPSPAPQSAADSQNLDVKANLATSQAWVANRS